MSCNLLQSFDSTHFNTSGIFGSFCELLVLTLIHIINKSFLSGEKCNSTSRPFKRSPPSRHAAGFSANKNCPIYSFPIVTNQGLLKFLSYFPVTPCIKILSVVLDHLSVKVERDNMVPVSTNNSVSFLLTSPTLCPCWSNWVTHVLKTSNLSRLHPNLQSPYLLVIVTVTPGAILCHGNFSFCPFPWLEWIFPLYMS